MISGYLTSTQKCLAYILCTDHLTTHGKTILFDITKLNKKRFEWRTKQINKQRYKKEEWKRKYNGERRKERHTDKEKENERTERVIECVVNCIYIV